jgi:hypothetical protein
MLSVESGVSRWQGAGGSGQSAGESLTVIASAIAN